MNAVVRSANRFSLRAATVLLLANLMILSTGCSWFKKGDKEQQGMGEMPTEYAAGQTPGAMDVPESVEPEGPRPGDLLPFPELQVIYFDYDRSTIRSDQLASIEHNLKYLKDHPEDKVLIAGHCDERGTSEYNYSLGERRAAAVREYLIKGGVNANRIAVLSKGEEEPIALGHAEASWSLNRRCEFQRMF
jgi:peptidoglycan-associated lipoprotein